MRGDMGRVDTWGQVSGTRSRGRESRTATCKSMSTHMKAPTPGVVRQDSRLVCVLVTGI